MEIVIEILLNCEWRMSECNWRWLQRRGVSYTWVREGEKNRIVMIPGAPGDKAPAG